MEKQSIAKIRKYVDKLSDVDYDEGATMTVSLAIELMKAGIVYELYEVTDNDDNGAEMVKQYAEAIDQLSLKNPADKVTIMYHPMGAFVIKEGEE